MGATKWKMGSTNVDGAFMEMRRLVREGRILLVIAAVIVLGLLLIPLLPFVQRTQEFNSILIVVDYIVTLGIAGPGVTFYLLRSYTDRALRNGTGVLFSRRSKLGIVSINWVVLAIILVITEFPSQILHLL